MSYSVHNYQAGEVIRSADLNEMDAQIAANETAAANAQSTADDAVPNTTKVNGHALSGDVSVTATDVGLGNVDNTSDANKPISTATQAALDGKVPTTRKVNGHALSSDVTVTKGDVGLGNVDNVQQVPATRKVNNKALSSDVTLYGSDIPMNSLDGTKLDTAVTDLKSALNAIEKKKSLTKSAEGSYTLDYNLESGKTYKMTVVSSRSNAAVVVYDPSNVSIVTINNGTPKTVTPESDIAYLKLYYNVNYEITFTVEELGLELPEIQKRIGDLGLDEKEIDLVLTSVKAISNEITIAHQETVTANTHNTVMFDTPIMAGTTFKVSNNSDTAQFSIYAVKLDGTKVTIRDTAVYKSTPVSFTLDYDVYGFDCYVNGTDWDFKVEFGNTGSNSLVSFNVDQSSKTSEQKQMARNNIGAANASVESDVLIDKAKDIFSQQALTNNYIKWSDGTLAPSSSGGKASDYIEAVEGEVLSYSLKTLGDLSAVIACYDSSKNYLQSKSVHNTGTSGSYSVMTGTFTVPFGVSYIRFGTYSYALNDNYLNKIVTEKLKDYAGNPWNGKKWAAFGDSLTDENTIDPNFNIPYGVYPAFLADIGGLVEKNFGIAGGSFLSDIMNKVLSTDVSFFDLVTIEGGGNDWATSKPLGEVGDEGNDTFAGTIYQMANYVYSNSNATLFFITTPAGRYWNVPPYGDARPENVNSLGLKRIDYQKMIISQCQYFDIPCIRAGENASINKMTGDLYFRDHIHHTYIGGKQYAQTIWDILKNYSPRIISLT